MSGIADIIIENRKLKVALDIALGTLTQIATTPRNRGAKRNANATVKFIETQFNEKKDFS